MKKVLFATTALVATTGIAAAQSVEVSGSAEMGIVGGESSALATFGTEIETQFIQSIDVDFTMSGTADNGLTFGASIDLDDAADMAIVGDDPIDSTGFSDFTVFISGEWGTLTMGDTDGALDNVMSEVALAGGSLADNETAHAGYLGSYLDGSEDGQILRYDYTFDAFTFSVSVEADDDGEGSTAVSPFTAGDIAGAPLASPSVALTSTGAATFYTPDDGQWSGGFFGSAVPSSVFPNGIYSVEALDFDLDGDTVLDIEDGTSVVALPNTGAVFIDGIWDPASVAGPYGTTFIGVVDTLMDIEAFSTGNPFNPVDDDYAISGIFGGAPDFSADALSYVDDDEANFAVGLQYSFDTGMGTLTVGGGYQQGGEVYASQLNQTIAGTTTAVASGTDLTDDVAGADADEVELSETILAHDQEAYGISASFGMSNGFSVGVQYTEIDNFAAMGYSVAIDSTAADGTSAVVTNAMFSDATHWGVGAAYEWDAWTFAANYGQYDLDAGFDDRSGWGAVANYDFGGGLEAQFGYGWSEVGDAEADNWSFGLSMSF